MNTNPSRISWLARRDNGGPLGRFLRSRERFIHISAPLTTVEDVIVPARTVGGIELPAVTVKRTVVDARNVKTLNIGRNVDKRHRRLAARGV